MQIEEQIGLNNHTTFHLGGPARYFTRVTSTQALREAIAWSKDKDKGRNLAFFVLGGGSNVLFGDRGFDGLVIKMDIKGIAFEENMVTAGAGEIWDALVEETVKRGLYGLENLSAIPGTVGAAPVQNIGAYGVEVKRSIAWVEVFDTQADTVRSMTLQECAFGYRDSIFKTETGKHLVITRVAFTLTKEGTLNQDYKDVVAYFKEYFKEHTTAPTLQDMRNAIIAIRSRKFPDIAKVGTAGSFFKNPIISKEHYAVLCSQFGDVPSWPSQEGFVKVPIAWFLDRFGWKDVRRGSAGTWQAQPLVLVHYGGGSSDDVVALADEITEDIRTRTGIVLEREVRIV